MSWRLLWDIFIYLMAGIGIAVVLTVGPQEFFGWVF
jgi:hypothetical protein